MAARDVGAAPALVREQLPAVAGQARELQFASNTRRVTLMLYNGADSETAATCTGKVSFSGTDGDAITVAATFPIPAGTAWTHEFTPAEAARLARAGSGRIKLYVASATASAYVSVQTEGV